MYKFCIYYLGVSEYLYFLFIVIYICINICCDVFVDFVTDFDFSPFDDYLLSTCSQDGTVSILACFMTNRWSLL